MRNSKVESLTFLPFSLELLLWLWWSLPCPSFLSIVSLETTANPFFFRRESAILSSGSSWKNRESFLESRNTLDYLGLWEYLRIEFFSLNVFGYRPSRDGIEGRVGLVGCKEPNGGFAFGGTKGGPGIYAGTSSL